MEMLSWTILFSFRNSCQLIAVEISAALKNSLRKAVCYLTNSKWTMKIREGSLTFSLSEVYLSLLYWDILFKFPIQNDYKAF